MRSTVVEQRDLEQWFLRITNYAQELLDASDKLEGWPEKVRTMQRNWIGRSDGAKSCSNSRTQRTRPTKRRRARTGQRSCLRATA